MRNYFTNLLILFIFVSLLSCTTAKFIPKNNDVHQTTFGSYIDIRTIENKKIRGEIIAVDEDQITVLDMKFEIVEVNKSKIKKYQIIVLENNRYILPSVLLQALTLSHGFFSLLTFPITGVNILIINITAINAFKFNSKEIPYENLFLFARFPQGIPEEIELDQIKR